MRNTYFSVLNYFGWSKLLSKYEYVSFLGSGSFGVVIKVRNKNGKMRAVKLVDSQDDTIKRELEIFKKVHHENVVEFYGYSFEKTKNLGGPWINDITTFLKGKKPPELYVAMVVEICEGIVIFKFPVL